MIDFACVSSTTPTWSNDPRWCIPGIAATEAEHAKLAADRASSAPVQGVHRYYPFVVEDRGRLGKSALTVVYIFAVLLAVRNFPSGVAAAVGNGPPAPVSEDDVMGVGEDPVGEDGMDIDAPAWPPADVEAADEGVIRKGDPGDFYMKVIAKKFRGVWHYGVITGVVTEWVLEDYGGATQWRAVFEDGDIVDLLRSEVVEAMAAAQEHPPVDADGDRCSLESGKVTVQSGWVMEDCLHHMETFSILNAGPLFEEVRVKAILTDKELASPAVVRSVSRLAVLGHMYKRLQGAAWFVTRWGLQNVVTEEDGPERKAQVDALNREGRTRDPARRQGAAAGAARRQGAAAGAARRQGEWDGRDSDCYRVRRSIVCSSNAAFPVA
eukprot:jgi/Tetstr1/445727/TSEL_033375.t1